MRRIHRGVILTALLAAAGPAAAQDILREAVGDRAAAVSAMELKPFDHALWSALSGWTNGQALDTSATDGKVVLIATWASWNPAARQVLSMLQSLKHDHADDGLIVVGVHSQTGWDNAADTMTKRKADFLIAHDAEGRFREAVRCDQDPDFYVIDRAGQLRYADIRTESVQAAVEGLLAEDAATAGSLVDRMAAEHAAREAALRKPQEIQDDVALRALPEVPFVKPPEAAYGLANWPERKVDDDNRNQNDAAGPRPVGLPGSWFGGEPPKTDGRAVVYYQWELDDPRSAQIVRRMDTLQKQLGRNAVIVGVLTGVHSEDRNNYNNDNQTSPEQMLARMGRFRTIHGVSHPMTVDLGGQLFQAQNNSGGGSDQGYQAMVVSSDSILRWQGSVSEDAFDSALDRVVDIDPGVRARRAAEETYLRARGG